MQDHQHEAGLALAAAEEQREAELEEQVQTRLAAEVQLKVEEERQHNQILVRETASSAAGRERVLFSGCACVASWAGGVFSRVHGCCDRERVCVR